MNDLLTMMSQIVIDIQGFNESHFGIFPVEDRNHLSDLWNNKACHNPNIFISLLSHQHKQIIAKWASDRTSFTIKELIDILGKFMKFLKTIKSSVSTITASSEITPKKLKGWRKMVYNQPKV